MLAVKALGKPQDRPSPEEGDERQRDEDGAELEERDPRAARSAMPADPLNHGSGKRAVGRGPVLGIENAELRQVVPAIGLVDVAEIIGARDAARLAAGDRDLRGRQAPDALGEIGALELLLHRAKEPGADSGKEQDRADHPEPQQTLTDHLHGGMLVWARSLGHALDIPAEKFLDLVLVR